MPKVLKRLLVTVLIIALIGGGIVGGLILFRNLQKEPVNVYAVSDFAMTEYWGDNSQTYGMVTTDKLQDVYISDTQQVSEIYVEVGQQVKVGDPLLAYDTTLSDIDLEKAGIELQKLQITLEDAKLELENIINMRPHYTILITPEAIGVEYIPQPTPALISGAGTKEDPFYYLWGQNDTLSTALASQWFPTKPPESEAPAEPEAPAPATGEEGSGEDAAPEAPAINYNESYVVLIVRQHNALNAPILSYWDCTSIRAAGKFASVSMSRSSPMRSSSLKWNRSPIIRTTALPTPLPNWPRCARKRSRRSRIWRSPSSLRRWNMSACRARSMTVSSAAPWTAP